MTHPFASRVAGMTTPTLADVVSAIEYLYPPHWADDWDAVGLAIGDLASDVRTVLFAVDPVQAVVDEAIDGKVDLLVVHHPLLLHPVSSVSTDSPKGRVVHELIRHGIALYVAHTNADSPSYGVSESLAFAFGLDNVRPLVPDRSDPLDKIVTFVPHGRVQRVIDALANAGAGSIGDYDRCAFLADGEGTFRPGPVSNPAIGTRGEIEVVSETRIEMVLPRVNRDAVVEALRRAHPYEEPAFDVFEIAGWAADRGSGRIGSLRHPMTLREFADEVASAVPATAVGARVSGDLEREVSVVAVAGGAGDFLLDQARASGADVYVTSDLRHHPASEFREHPESPGLIDIPHWAAEWTWLPVVQDAMAAVLDRRGLAVKSEVSRLCTDPWNYRASGDEASS
jgi:dinuclear metal center YbgI/SA1388 family protein